MRAALAVLVVLLLHHADSVPCREDPSKSIGETWTCSDPCFTCTCEADGHVASVPAVTTDPSCAQPANDSDDSAEVSNALNWPSLVTDKGCSRWSQVFEATLVRVGMFGILLVFAAGMVICFFMCCKGGSDKAAVIVRELHEADDA